MKAILVLRDWGCLAVSLLNVSLVAADTSAPPQILGDLSPADALQAFETEPGFTVELVAAEPLTIDPIALAFDEHGRLLVAEGRDYPTGSPDGRPLGVIALLEDTDGDGRMDKRTELAAGIKFPNGVMPWRGSVIVTASPDVWLLKDTDGDGRADVKELLLTGFSTDTTSQLRANDPTLGPDGWVYLAGGLRGGKVHSPKRPAFVLDLEKGDLRFNPDTGEMELTDGKSQYGLAFDDAGNRFACMNRVQSQHAPLTARYLSRNPFLVAPGVLQNCPEITDNTLMIRYTAGAVRYYPISANITTADSHVGTYSAACAVHIYRGDSLPREYAGAAFSCDPTGNLVRADRLEKAGGTFAARRIRDGTEALRSRDNWFRPVFLADGPDGALYVADMYRMVIEHPEYLPGDVRKHMDFDAGKDKGRIWRLGGAAAGAHGKSSREKLDLATADSSTLVSELSSTIPWRRDTAFRLLIERHDLDAIPALKRAFMKSMESGPAVLQLQLLRQFGALDDGILERAVGHPQPGVRQNALRFSEPRLASSQALRALAFACADDADPHVRFQAALSLGEIADASIIPLLARVAGRQAHDPWTRAAILSSLRDRDGVLAMVAELVKRPERADDGVLTLVNELGRQIGVRPDEGGSARGFAGMRSVTASAAPEFQIAAVLGFADAAKAPLGSLTTAEQGPMHALFAVARKWSAMTDIGGVRRLYSIRLLAHDDSPEATAVLRERLAPSEPIDIQIAAARALLCPARVAIASQLLSAEAWNSHSPALRTVLLGVMTGRAELAGALLDAIEAGAVPMGVLTPAQRDQLRKAKDHAVRARAEKLLATPGGNRQEAFEAAKAALKLKPDPSNGRVLFKTHCSACHRLNQEGVAVGPDLFDIRNQPKESILYHIIVPEAEITPSFVNYECETKDGRALIGVLATESASAITLRMAQGVEEIISRAQIEKLTASRLSLMPQEMEKAMSNQDMADLLAYLRGEQ